MQAFYKSMFHKKLPVYDRKKKTKESGRISWEWDLEWFLLWLYLSWLHLKKKKKLDHVLFLYIRFSFKKICLQSSLWNFLIANKVQQIMNYFNFVSSPYLHNKL